MADRSWARSFALACQDAGLDRPKRLALIRYATQREVASSMDVRSDEVVHCWQALLAYNRWELELFDENGTCTVRERSVG